ncbi:MAG: hypothetical protein WEA11_04805 [Acidimicrobiales bacterium]
MHRISRLGRLAAAAVLVASGATVALAAPASAANTPYVWNCSAGTVTQSIGNSDILTVTLGANCTRIIRNQPLGTADVGTVTLNGVPLPGAQLTPVTGGEQLVITAPASGSFSIEFSFWPNLNPPPGGYLSVTQSPPPTTSTTTTSTTTAGSEPVVPAFTG